MAFPERKYGKVAGRDKGEVRAGPGSGSDSGVCPGFPEPPPAWLGRQVSGRAPWSLCRGTPGLASVSQRGVRVSQGVLRKTEGEVGRERRLGKEYEQEEIIEKGRS